MNIVVSVLIFLSVGALFVALSVPLIRRRVKPNMLYGLRIRATLADERVWFEANAKSGRDLLVLGLGISVMAVGLALVSGMTSELHMAILVGVTGIGAVVVTATGVSRANRLLRNREVGTDDGERSA